jgi:hypothetical protein
MNVCQTISSPNKMLIVEIKVCKVCHYSGWENRTIPPRAQMVSPSCFTKSFSQLLGITEFIALVKGFEKVEINIARLNYAMIILISKEEEATTLKKFRPISLINCSLKVFSKALNNRLESISDRLLAPNQITFVKGRYILESVVPAHEIIHKTVKNKEK